MRAFLSACVCGAVVLASTPAAVASGPPAIDATGVTNIQGVSGLLTGKVNPEGTGTTYRFEYVGDATFQADQPNGFAHATPTPEAGAGAGSQDWFATAAISGLSPDTTYHYRLVAQSTAGTTLGSAATFTTTHGFGFLPGAAGFHVASEVEGGLPDLGAGTHPYVLRASMSFNQGGEFQGQPGVPFTDGDVRDMQIDMPVGLVGNPDALPKCGQALFNSPRSSPFEASASGESCPDNTQIGVVRLDSSREGGSTRTFGVFNLAPGEGVASAIGVNAYGIPIVFDGHVRTREGEYGVTLEARDIPQSLDIYALELVIWGTPWGVSHDGQRGNCLNEAEPAFPHGKCSVGPPGETANGSTPPRAYLTLPTSCDEPIAFKATADSWQQPTPVSATSVSENAEGDPHALTECNAVPFIAGPSARATNPRAGSPTGFDFEISEADEHLTSPKLRAVSQVKDAVVSLPEGITINPSVAAGLGVCTPAGYAEETVSSPLGVGCPEDSKIGEFTVKTPLFEETVDGSIFLAQPDNRTTTTPGEENPFDSLFAMYLIAKLPSRGIMVKVPGELAPDPGSGRLVGRFEDLPQLPYSSLKVHFRESQRAPLVTPTSCGDYTTQSDISPWINPEVSTHAVSITTISFGSDGGPCPSSAEPPFDPIAQGGMLNSNAGSYTPFYLHITRTDSEQEITSYSTKLPPGLLGKIAGIPYCPDAAIEAAKKETGTEELEHPSCPPATEIGHTVSGYGVGATLAYAPGGLYLAGPYKGSAFSIVAIDSAVVGPLDLGTVIVRSAIDVDPQNAQVSIDSATSDPIPHILEGIPIHLRDIRVYISRPEGTINPTSCEPFSLLSTLTGSTAPFTNPRDVTAIASDHFQVSNCAALKFTPKLGFTMRGGTGHGDFPELEAVVHARPGDADIASAAVSLPPSISLEQKRIRAICTKVQFKKDACPPGSVYGHAEVFTPLLAEPMQGSVYLGSSTTGLPDLVVGLRGHGIAINLDGHIDKGRNGGIRTTFSGLPDAPITKFLLTINGGKRGLLVNFEDLCASAQVATVRLVSQSNAGEVLHPRLGIKCPKRRAPQHHRAGGRR